MKQSLLVIALICSLFLFSSLPAALAKKTSSKNKTIAANTQSQEPVHEEELILLPELLDRLEGGTGDDTDFGPELRPQDSEDSEQSTDKSNDDEQDLMDMEDDSDEIAEIYREEQALKAQEGLENEEKSLLNIGDREIDVEDGKNLESDTDGEIGMSAVDVDGRSHEFEVPSCSVVEIPINSQSVKVTVSNVMNSSIAMLTDGQYSICGQFLTFECPADAVFCRKESLIGKDSVDFELDQEACGIENVYLYILPEDMQTSVTYRVMAEDLGEPQCDDNSDDSQLNPDTQEEQEAAVVPTEDSEEEDDESDGSDDEEINDDQMLEATAEVDGKFHAYEFEICTVLEIPVNQQPVNIKFDGVFNTEKIMVTDVKLASCSKLSEFRCPIDSTFCQIESFDDPQDIQLASCNTQTAYLYVYPEELEGVTSYQVNITTLNQSQCQDGAVVPIVSDQSETESESESTETPVPSTDDSSETPAPATEDSTEAPATEDSTETPATSEESTDAQATTSTDEDTGDSEVPTDSSQTISDGKSRTNGWAIVAIIFGCSFAIFMAVVCFYRHQFKKNRVELFSPPSWCPMFLFPRSNEGLINRQLECNEYEPPVL